MAAGSLSEPFSFDLKRKRRHDDDDDMMNEHDLFSTKRHFTQLPIRSPPRPSIAITSSFGQYGIPPGTLTPDSIPEDEVFPSNEQSHQQSNSSYQRPHSSPNPSTGSLQVAIDENVSSSTDMDMDLSSPKLSHRPPPTPLRIGRARSNDLMSPLRSPGAALPLLSPISRSFAQDRVPTPVASSFPGRSPFESSFASAAARQLRPQSHLLQQHSTVLSPMVDAESWTPQIQRPPSPEPDMNDAFDEDSMMAGIEDSNMSSSFTNLSVHSQDNLGELPNLQRSPPRQWSPASTSPRNQGLGLDAATNSGMIRPDNLRMSTITDSHRPTSAHGSEHSTQHGRNQSSGRVAKLHMGFRADCEKCIARVPGHYSHIIWS